jgi:hypothetical protein
MGRSAHSGWDHLPDPCPFSSRPAFLPEVLLYGADVRAEPVQSALANHGEVWPGPLKLAV